MVEASFACNNPHNGAFNGDCGAVRLQIPSSSLVSLASPNLLEPESFAWEDGYVTLEGERFHVRNRAEWVGNWCWDGGEMKRPEALRLLRHLLAAGWHLEEWSCDGGPFLPVIEAYQRGEVAHGR